MESNPPHDSIDISRTIGPLRLIFWGGLICVVDIAINGVDLVHDLIGMVMIVWGVVVLSGIKVDDHYRKAMLFVKVVAILEGVRTLLGVVPADLPGVVSFLLTLVALASMIAIVVFCLAMRRLSLRADLKWSAQSWKVTTLLFVIIYLIPIGLFYGVAAVYMVAQQTFNFNFGGGAALVMLVVFFVPLIHLFISTSRMRREAILKETQEGSSANWTPDSQLPSQ